MAARTRTAGGDFWQRRANARRLEKLLAYGGLTLLGILYAIPFFWMVTTSLKPPWDIERIPPTWIPSEFAWENYPNALLKPTRYFPLFFRNVAAWWTISSASFVVAYSSESAAAGASATNATRATSLFMGCSSGWGERC